MECTPKVNDEGKRSQESVVPEVLGTHSAGPVSKEDMPCGCTAGSCPQTRKDHSPVLHNLQEVLHIFVSIHRHRKLNRAETSDFDKAVRLRALEWADNCNGKCCASSGTGVCASLDNQDSALLDEAGDHNANLGPCYAGRVT